MAQRGKRNDFVNNELEKRLLADFPFLYRGHDKPPGESSMCWGFECGDGWFQLIYQLSRNLTDHMEKTPSVAIEVTQVKSKFGGLRFDVIGADEACCKLISEACEAATKLCELTGGDGQLCVHVAANKQFSRNPPMVLCAEKAAELGYTPLET